MNNNLNERGNAKLYRYVVCLLCLILFLQDRGPNYQAINGKYVQGNHLFHFSNISNCAFLPL